MTQQSASEYLSHGQIPFFRLPLAPVAASAPERARAVLLGVPYDGGTTYRPGARLAPFEVRRVSALLQGYHPGHHLSVFERLPAFSASTRLPAHTRSCELRCAVMFS